MQHEQLHDKGKLKLVKDACFGIAVSSGVGIVVAIALILLVLSLAH